MRLGLRRRAELRAAKDAHHTAERVEEGSALLELPFCGTIPTVDDPCGPNCQFWGICRRVYGKIHELSRHDGLPPDCSTITIYGCSSAIVCYPYRLETTDFCMYLEKGRRGMTSLRLRAELLLASDEDSGWTHLPNMEYQVPLSVSVEELTTELLQDSVQSGSSSVNIKPEQCLYLFLNGRIFGPQDASCTLQEIGAEDGMDAYLTKPLRLTRVFHSLSCISSPHRRSRTRVSGRNAGV